MTKNKQKRFCKVIKRLTMLLCVLLFLVLACTMLVAVCKGYDINISSPKHDVIVKIEQVKNEEDNECESLSTEKK